MTTNPNLDQAREWARDAHPWDHPEAVATAKVINSLPDEWIDADKLRETIEFHRDRLPYGAEEDLKSLLPTSQPRTLKDMTPEEREDCVWMQADYDNGFTEHPVRVVITVIYPNVVDILLPNGARSCVRNEEITPRLDLPRMEWPKDTPEVEEGVYGQALWDMITKAIRDEKEYHIDAQDYEGVKRWLDVERALRTAMETNPPKESPAPLRPEDVPEGEVWIVECYGDRHVGTRDPNEAPNWALARMDGADVTFASDDHVAALVTRLVPEVKA